MKKQTLYAWMTVLVGCAMVTSVAFFYFKFVTGSFVPTVLPEIQADQTYYLAQAKEVLDGFPMLGNPYSIEHAGERFPGLLLPVWLTALPGFLGLHINTVFTVNAFFYSILLGGLIFAICNKMNSHKVWTSAAIAILGVASLHNLMIRPAIMQTVYPVFALFTLALLLVLENPQRKSAYAFLGAMTATSFYLYPYLWMITFCTIGLLAIRTILTKNWKALLYMIVMGLCIVLVCIPQILTSSLLFADAAAKELMGRIGIVETHLIHPLAILYAKYTILITAGLVALRTQRKFKAAELLLFLLATSVLIATCSNSITGKELHFDTHFWRIGMFVNIIAIAVFIEMLKETRLQRAIAGVCLAAVLLTTINRVAIRAGGFVYLTRSESIESHIDVQSYDVVLQYFLDEGIEHAVVLAPSLLNAYIPLYTKNYVYYNNTARSHSISNAEHFERFLLHNIDRINEEFLIEQIVSYAGWKAERTASIMNAYGDNVEPIDLMGGQTFIDKALEMQADLDRTYDISIRKYQIDYAIFDAEAEYNPRLPTGSTPVFQTDRFTIYKMK